MSISAKGGGLTFGKSKIVDAKGTFTGATDISELYGTYAMAGAHAGAGKAKAAQVVTKGPVSLAFTGTGTGVDVGFSFGKFEIKRSK